MPDIAVPAHFADEPPARLQSPPDAGDDLGRSQHPLRSAASGKHRIELGIERERVTGHHPRVKAEGARGRHLLGTAVDPDDVDAKIDQLPGQRAVAAAEIKNALACTRCQQLHHRLPQLGATNRAFRAYRSGSQRCVAGAAAPTGAVIGLAVAVANPPPDCLSSPPKTKRPSRSTMLMDLVVVI